MGTLSVLDVKEKVIKKEGAGCVCLFCACPVIAMDFDVELRLCFFPISHKTKRKFYCPICNIRLMPAPSA